MSLNFAVDIAGKQVLLTREQLEVVWDVVHGATVMEDKWVGSGKGTSGSSNEYVPIIKTFEAHKDLAIKAVSQEQIEAIKFVMKQQEQ